MPLDMIPSGVKFTLGFLVVAYLLWWTYTRAMSDTDPSASVVLESETGATTFLTSGTHLMTVGAIVVVAITWPLVVEVPLIGVFLVLVVGANWVMEKQEAA